MFPESLRPEKGMGFKACDGLSNVLNFGYYVLKCRVHKALLYVKLELYLGFLRTVQVGKPSLVCDFQELYRYLIDDYLLERCRNLRKKDFCLTTDILLKTRIGKRVHLIDYRTNDLAEGITQLFEKQVKVPRVRHGSNQSLNSLICEEAFLLAKFLRNERNNWIPRIVSLA